MQRETIIPQRTVREEISSLQESPPTVNAPGRVMVTVTVERVDGAGTSTVPEQYETYTIEGDDFAELTGEPPAWAPDKPPGTYRNADLWHFIDLLR